MSNPSPLGTSNQNPVRWAASKKICRRLFTWHKAIKGIGKPWPWFGFQAPAVLYGNALSIYLFLPNRKNMARLSRETSACRKEEFVEQDNGRRHTRPSYPHQDVRFCSVLFWMRSPERRADFRTPWQAPLAAIILYSCSPPTPHHAKQHQCCLCSSPNTPTGINTLL